MKEAIGIEKLKKYLLGLVSEDFEKEIDLYLISNIEFEEEINIAEDLLIEDYLEGELTKDEINLFQTNFLTSDDRKQRLKTIEQLKQYSRDLDFEEIITDDSPKEESGLFKNIINLFTRTPIPAFATVVIFFAVLGGIWVFSNGQTDLEQEYARRNNGDVRTASKLNNANVFLLTNGIVRSNDDDFTAVLRISDIKEDVWLNIPLRSKFTKDETYKIELSKDNKILFTQSNIKPLLNEYEGELLFVLPGELLKNGQYKIKLSSNQNKANTITYPFFVE